MGKKDHKATTVSALNPKTSTEDSILNIVNETEEQICQLPFDNASQLQLIYDFIENSGLNQMRPFKLCENLFDDDALPLALEMSKLPSRKVYVLGW